MSRVEGGPRPGLFARVKGILLRPTLEWEAIEAEPATVRGLYLGYVAPLAAIGPICGLIGSLVFGFGVGGLSFRPSLVSAVMGALFGYLMQLASVFILALVIDALAPSFHGQSNRIQAFKLAAYSATAAWLAGVFGIVPNLALLGVVGLYSLYLFYRGLPPLMKAPRDKAAGYTAVVVAIGFILALLGSFLSNAVMRIGIVPPPGAVSSNNVLRLPGGAGQVDVGRLEDAAKQLQQQGSVDGGKTAPTVSGEELQTLLPADLPNGYLRTEVENSSGGVGPMAIAGAKGSYSKGESRLVLEVTDLGPVGALAGAFNVNALKDSGSKYARVHSERGRMITEEYDRDANSGSYAVVVASRFAVKADGDKVTIGDLKAAVETVDFERLEALAKG